MSTHGRILVSLAGLALAAVSASEANAGDRYAKHHFVVGPELNARMAWQVDKIVDLDGDGVTDFMAGAPEGDGNGLNGSGKVVIYSGASGRVIRTLEGTLADGRMGTSVADAGDVDGDGFHDIVAGAPRETEAARTRCGGVYLFSGRDGSLLFHVFGESADDQLGTSVAGVGDINDDGVPDVAASAPFYDAVGPRSGMVYVLSGVNGAQLRRLPGIAPDDQAGSSIAAIGDTDRDGFTELAVGAIHGRSLLGGLNAAGNVLIFSPRTGRRILRIDGTAAGDQIGRVVGDAGDVNADGTPDVVTGAPNASPNGQAFAGSVFVYSGRDGRLLRRFNGETQNVSFGNAADGAGDVDGDGFDDILAGAPHTLHTACPNGTIYVYSGGDGSLLYDDDGLEDAFAYSCAGAGDIDGDNVPDFIVGAPDYNTFTSPFFSLEGAVTVYTSRSMKLRRSAAVARLGDTVTMTIDAVPADAGRRYALLVGRSAGEAITPLLYPVGPGNASALDLVPAPTYLKTVARLTGVLDGNGDRTIDLPVPFFPSLIDKTFFFQPVLVQAPGRQPRVVRIGRPSSVTIAR